MKVRRFFFGLCWTLLAVLNTFGQPLQSERLYIPLLSKESQSNVTVTVSDFGQGQPCPPKFTNAISNTNLFTPAQRSLIEAAFAKYIDMASNSVPSGATLVTSYKTNVSISAGNKTVESEFFVRCFRYTNSDAQEFIKTGAGMSAEFRDGLGNGYNVSFNRTGGGTLFSFGEITNNLQNGLLARFEDAHSQGLSWDYRLSDFKASRLTEYRQYSNGLVFGKLLVWNLKNGNLIIDADFNEPYDWNKNRVRLESK